MTARAPVTGVRATVAEQVAGRLLAPLRDERCTPAAADIDWAGAVELPGLTEERAVQAACGVMHVHGRAAGRPEPLAVDYVSAAAGVCAAQGVLAAQVARSRGAELSGVRTSVAQAALFTLTQYLAAAYAGGEADDGVGSGAEPGSGGTTLTSADGVRFECETLDAARWREFWALLGVDGRTAGRGWRHFQYRYATAVCPLPPGLHEAAGRATYDEIRAAAERAGASVLEVRSDHRAPSAVAPWTWQPHPARGVGGREAAVREARGRDAAGPAQAPVNPAPVNPAPPVPVPWVPAPAVPSAGPSADAPLAGLRVVESTRRVQGPMAGHVLRRLGAHVVRVEPPGGDPMRGIPPLAGGCSARFRALNDGKDVAEVDLAAERGRRELRELVAGADVFLHNWAPGRAARWRLDADDLCAVRPGLVYAWAGGWGGEFGPEPPRGPEPPLGTDFLVQAHSGLAAALRPAGQLPAPSLMTLTDVLGGLLSAAGVLAGLVERERTGRGGRVDSSLHSAACAVPRPRRRPLRGPLDRPLATGDGLLWLGADARNDSARLAGPLGLPGGAGPDAVTARLRTRPSDDWLPRLAEAGLTATPVCTDLRRLVDDPRFAAAVSVGGHATPRDPWEFQ